MIASKTPELLSFAQSDESSLSSPISQGSSILASQEPSESRSGAAHAQSGHDRPRSTSSHSFDKSAENKSCGQQQCAECGLTYGTRGQLNTHVTRKHRRQHCCTRCSATFALKADLHRHDRSVHRNVDVGQVFMCTNPLCTIPTKVFIRKDNFQRHYLRCSKRHLCLRGHSMDTINATASH
ncbi:hypothetical protein IQ07DRAFT_90176 [Pyrenochaeta sp. DS3sAY3a]|nr:hypothetical protein IQ07DRAFT_90176 [Pyrenochaeta sp. DS3sAY3a]